MHSLHGDLRNWMLGGLTAAAGTLFVLIVSAVLWGLLGLLGDESGRDIARGIALLAGGASLGSLYALVVLLTWDRIANGHALMSPAEPSVNGVYDEHPAA